MSTYPGKVGERDENPEWTDEDFAGARPAAEVLPKLFGSKIATEFSAIRMLIREVVHQRPVVLDQHWRELFLDDNRPLNG